MSEDLYMQHEELLIHINDMYSDLNQTYDDPGCYYDLICSIARAEARLERLANQLIARSEARLKRLTNQLIEMAYSDGEA